MKKIGITGNIACGKSAVSKIILGNKYPLIDADDIVMALYNDNRFINILKELFPLFVENNRVLTNKIAECILNDKKQKKEFESFIFPYVKQEINKFFDIHKNEQKIFIIVPLLFEAKMEDDFDKIILIYANDELRKQRLAERKTLLSNYIDKVFENQISQDEKKEKCDFVIYNNGTLDELKCATEKLLNAI